MRREIAEAAAKIVQEVRPGARVIPVHLDTFGGHTIWGVDVYFDVGDSRNQVLATLDEFASWLHRQEQTGFTASI